MARILVLNGPNLNLLGTREPERYGRTTLAEIEAELRALGERDAHEVVCFQSNAEHALIERVHAARDEGAVFAILNPAGLTHTSVALRDAFLGVALPFIEVHLSNIHRREAFRKHSYFSDVAVGVIAGLGAQGYALAYQAAVRHLAAS